MRKILKLLSVFLILAAFTNCQKDDSLLQDAAVNTKSGTITSRLITGAEALQLQEEAVAHIDAGETTNKFIYAGKEITVLEDEVFEFKDRHGTLHYTYRAIHTNPVATTFYNVVMSRSGNFKRTMLIKYAMTDKFMEQYNNDGIIDTFEGQITFTTLNSDSGFPCDDTPQNPITMNPGAGSNGGSGGSSGGGGASGGGGNTGGGNNGGGGLPGNGNGNPYVPGLAYLNLTLTVAQNGIREVWVEVSRTPRWLSVTPFGYIAKPMRRYADWYICTYPGY